MRYSEIDQSPPIVGDTDWNLSDPASNAARAKSLLDYGPDVLETFPAGALVRLAGEHGGQFGLISRTNHLEYYVHYEVGSIGGLGRCATQVKLWRKRTASVQGLAAKVFDQYLLSMFDTIVSDSRQTQRGMEFWQVQLGGHGQSKSVGLLLGDTIALYDPDVDMDEWLATVDGWGRPGRFRQRRFFISNLSRAVIVREGAAPSAAA